MSIGYSSSDSRTTEMYGAEALCRLMEILTRNAGVMLEMIDSDLIVISVPNLTKDDADPYLYRFTAHEDTTHAEFQDLIYIVTAAARSKMIDASPGAARVVGSPYT